MFTYSVKNVFPGAPVNAYNHNHGPYPCKLYFKNSSQYIGKLNILSNLYSFVVRLIMLHKPFAQLIVSKQLTHETPKKQMTSYNCKLNIQKLQKNTNTSNHTNVNLQKHDPQTISPLKNSYSIAHK